MFLQYRKTRKCIIGVIALVTLLQAVPGTHACCSFFGKCQSTVDSGLDGDNAEHCLCHSSKNMPPNVCEQDVNCARSGFDSSHKPPCQCPPDCSCRRAVQLAIAPVAKDIPDELRATRVIATSPAVASGSSRRQVSTVLPSGCRCSSALELCSLLCRFTT